MTAPAFKYVFVPADSSAKIIEYVGSTSGGLDKDELRLKSEEFFSSSHADAINPMGTAGSVEIVSLMLPCAANGFIGVSMYCDSYSKTRNLDGNARATSIANICGYTMQVLGDVFFGRYHDDESMDWERLDFGIEDLSSDAAWVAAAHQMNKGKKMGGATTSAMLQNMLNSNNTAVVDGAADDKPSGGEQTLDDFLCWSQGNDEIEVKVRVQGPVKASDLAIKIRSKHLQVLPKAAGRLEPWASAGDSLHPIMRGGADLWGAIDPDCSGWTLEKGKGEEVTIVFTLAKAKAISWPALVIV